MFWDFLKEFGFSSYELKALQGLVRLGAATPSEISEVENIPSSKIYSALDRLEDSGLVTKTSEDNTYQLADQYQITTILGELQKQKSQEFNDSLGNLAKYLSHQSKTLGKSTHTLVEGVGQIEQKLVFPSLVAPHNISIYWNLFSPTDLQLLTEFIQRWNEVQRDYVDRLLIYSTFKPELDTPFTRKLSIRHTNNYRGNPLVLWGQKQVGLVISSLTQNHSLAIDISDEDLASEYLNEFEQWWFDAQQLNQN